MKIIFTGGGSGGHFYPIIAVVEAVKRLVKEKKLLAPDLYYFSPEPYNPGLLYDLGLEYKKTTAGKMRRYFSLLNLTDFFKTVWGVISALLDVFDIYPDVVFGKGAYGSFPTLLAARILRIPVVIHESDAAPGRVNRWAGKFASHIAISYPEASKYFRDAEKKGKVLHSGQPVRGAMREPISNGAHRFFEFEEGIKTILVLGGSQGSEIINSAILDVLPKLAENYQIIHQAGNANLKVVAETAEAILLNHKFKKRYKVFGYLNNLEQQMAAGAADLVLSRAGSTIFEIASWGKASIIIPITDSNGDHQKKNALAYAASGACSVIEEANLTPNVLFAEIKRIMDDSALYQKMEIAAKQFFKPDADLLLARLLLQIALSHEELE